MVKFVKKLGLFTLILAIGWIVLYLILDSCLNGSAVRSNQNIYVWGDSQTAYGIDIPLLGKLSGKNVLSAANRGNGVYNFLVFAGRIPENSTVIIGLSGAIQLRTKKNDYNESALSFHSLWELHENNYSLRELLEIVYLNRVPQTLFYPEFDLAPYEDSIAVVEPLEVFEKIYSATPDYLKDKQRLYYSGFKQIKDKNCKIILVEFPYHPKLAVIENRSRLKVETDRFEADVMSLLNIDHVDTLILNAGKNPMLDYSHFNVVGADFMSDYLSKSLLNAKNNKLIKCLNPQ